MVQTPSLVFDHYHRYFPEFCFILDNITHVTDEQLQSRKMPALATVTLWLLRSVRRSTEFLQHLPQWSPWFKEILTKSSDQDLIVLLNYIFTVSDTSVDRILSAWKDVLGTEAHEMALTAAEQLRKEGFEKGIEKGIAKGRKQGVSTGKRKATAESVIAVLQARKRRVTPDIVERVLACSDIHLLNLWLTRAATVKHAMDIFDP